jgi:hypothetical protein
VATQQVDEPQTGQSSIWRTALIGLAVFGFVVWLVHKPVVRWIAVWRAHHNRPEAIAARKLRAACSGNDAPAAYAALMAWLATHRAADGQDRIGLFLDMEKHRPLREPWQTLSRHLFAPETTTTTWHGTQLWAAFSQMRRLLNRKSRASHFAALPALNPTAMWCEAVVVPSIEEVT